MILKTKNLNQAALLTALGGTLVEIQDKYPANTYVVSANSLMLWWERHVGLVRYRKYCNQRVRLKERARKASGLPARFTGRDEGFKFGDIARVTQARVE